MRNIQFLLLTLHQPFQLIIAALLFTYGTSHRKNWPIKTGCSIIVGFTLLRVFLMAIPGLTTNSFLMAILWSIGAFFILFIAIYAAYQISLQMAAYFSTLAYLTQHIAFCTWDAIIPGACYRKPEYKTLLDVAIDVLPAFLIFLGVYLFIYIFIVRSMKKIGYGKISTGQSFFTIFVVLLISIVFSTVVQNSFQHDNYLYRCCRIYAMICCILLLWQQVSFQSKLAQQQEMALQKQLWMRHKAQYDRAADSVKLINHKCHTLKCQLADLKRVIALSENGAEQAAIQEMEKSVSVYDSIIETGNGILDTILTEKSLLCAAQDITFTCVADGRAVGFLEAVDLFSMLGNALDNAEEAVKKLTDRDKRAISVSIFASHGIAIMQVENFYDGKLEFEDALPVTTKDPAYHGYGLKCIRSTAEKYGGTLSIQSENNIFLLRITLPTER